MMTTKKAITDRLFCFSTWIRRLRGFTLALRPAASTAAVVARGRAIAIAAVAVSSGCVITAIASAAVTSTISLAITASISAAR